MVCLCTHTSVGSCTAYLAIRTLDVLLFIVEGTAADRGGTLTILLVHTRGMKGWYTNHFTGTHQREEGVVHKPFYWYQRDEGVVH